MFYQFSSENYELATLTDALILTFENVLNPYPYFVTSNCRLAAILKF